MKKSIISLVLAYPLTACALWTDFVRPDTQTPGQWKAGAPTDTAWPDTHWWQQFKSSALTAQIEQAENNNFDLKAAVARMGQADAQSRINGSALLPAVDANAGASRDRSARTRTIRPRFSNDYHSGLSAAYEIDFWGKNYAVAESGRALAEASRFDEQTVRLTILSSVADTYFDIVGTKERLKVARENLANSGALLGTIQKRFFVGLVTALDVAQQESVVASQRAVIPPLEQHLQHNLNAQAVLLGALPENVESPADALNDITLPTVASGLPSELLLRRPDVQNAEAQLQASHADIIAARANFFPSIQLTASGGYQSAALGNLFRPDSMLYSIGASLAQPIFEGGALEGALELRKARYDELLQNYRKAALSAFADVEDALTAVEQTAAEESAQLTAVTTARRAYTLTQQQLTGGIIDITTVLNTQRTLFSAEDAFVQARLTHLQAIVALYKALGGGWTSGVTVEEPKPAQEPSAAARS